MNIEKIIDGAHIIIDAVDGISQHVESQDLTEIKKAALTIVENAKSGELVIAMAASMKIVVNAIMLVDVKDLHACFHDVMKGIDTIYEGIEQ